MLTATSAPPANLIDPGKRMLSSMTPTMVTRDGKLVLITGSPGGRTIINTVLTIVLGVTEYGLTGREAVDLTRMHHQWLPDSVSIEQPDGATESVITRATRNGTHSQHAHPPGRRRVHLGCPGRHAVRRQRQAQPGFEGVDAEFDSAGRRTVGLTRHVRRAAPSPAPSFLLRRAGRAARAHNATFHITQPAKAPPDTLRGAFLL